MSGRHRVAAANQVAPPCKQPATVENRSVRRIGIDVGGTFTDVVMVDDANGQVWSTKVPTTPKDRVVGAINGYRRILEISGSASADVAFLGHGTTMATN